MKPTTTKPKLTLLYHSDPGHGWLEVPTQFIDDELRSIISPYSYESTNKGIAFLEEDCDMPLFINHFKAQGITFDICDISTNKDHYCRNWPSFKGRKQ